METIRSWALSVIAAAVVTAVINFIAPSGNMEKSVKILSALFMLLCFVSPLVGAEFDQDNYDYNYEISEWLSDSELEREVRQEVVDKLKNEINSKLGAYIEGEGINEYEIKTKVDVDGNNSIKISKIEIILFAQADEIKIINYVEENFEITPDITVKNEGG